MADRPHPESYLAHLSEQPASISMVASLVRAKIIGDCWMSVCICKRKVLRSSWFWSGDKEGMLRRSVHTSPKLRTSLFVIWRRHLDETDLVQVHRKATFTVFPSWRKDSGLPGQESLWFGPPCLCADSGAVAKVASGRGCRCIPVQRLDRLINSLRQMPTNVPLRQRLSREALKRSFPNGDHWINRIFIASQPVRASLALTSQQLPCQTPRRADEGRSSKTWRKGWRSGFV